LTIWTEANLLKVDLTPVNTLLKLHISISIWPICLQLSRHSVLRPQHGPNNALPNYTTTSCKDIENNIKTYSLEQS